MDKQSFVLRESMPQVRDNAVAAILALDGTKAWDVTIRPYVKETRSQRQNKGYWGVWIPVAADYFGVSKDQIHNEWKTFFARVYWADPVNDDQRSWIQAYSDLKELGATKEQLDRMITLCSTKWANTKQFAGAMDDIDQAMNDRGLVLPEIDPEKRTT